MSQNSTLVFTLPEKNHKRLRKRLEIVISVYCSFRVNSDTTKHLQKHKYMSNKIIYNSVLERKRGGRREEKGERGKTEMDNIHNFYVFTVQLVLSFSSITKGRSFRIVFLACAFWLAYEGIFVYNICLISISDSVSDQATKITVLDIERA